MSHQVLLHLYCICTHIAQKAHLNNKKNGRNKKITIGEYPKNRKRAGINNEDDKYLRKYKKIDELYDDLDEEYIK